METTFNDFEIIFQENPIFLDQSKIKQELISHFEKNIDRLFKKLKETKLKEFDILFANKDNYV